MVKLKIIKVMLGFDIFTVHIIDYPFNISFVDNIKLNNFIWTKKTHKFLSNKKKSKIVTFMLCNKLMGIYKLPYCLLCGVIQIVLNYKKSEI